MPGALQGIKVIAHTQVVAMPACCSILADWGAEVIKVEPLTGEWMRGLETFLETPYRKKFDKGEVNPIFQMLNRNQKGLAVNLRHERGREIIYKLIDKADVFIANYEVNVLKKFGLDFASLSQTNPRLIHAVLTGYGMKGSLKDERGFDYTAAWARGGLMYLIGEPGSAPPPQRPGLMDMVAGVHMAAAVCAALFYRENTGIGQELTLSLYQTAVWTIGEDIQNALFGMPFPKSDRLQAPNPLWNTYSAKDGRWFQVAMLTEDYWAPFCKAIERPDLENNPRFSTAESRAQNRQELIQTLDQVMASRTMAEWEKRFTEYNLIYAPALSPTEITTDPQALANDFFISIEHPAAGKIKLVNSTARFSQTPASVRSLAPEVGQHTEEILLDLGYTWNDISELKDQGVIL